jgi:(4S)-4-hydroxy-5-phosphonooxypentane-2,3-dione isomerase
MPAALAPDGASTGQLLCVHVHVRVKAESIEAFRAASVANASASVREPGVARFDVIQDRDDPTRFVLVEVYRKPEAPAAHKETAHYKLWRDTVADMMAEPRTARRYANVFPADAGW